MTEAASDPFPYGQVDRVYPPETAAQLLEWLEYSPHWELTRTTFYEQFEFPVHDPVIPARLRPVFADESLADLADRVGALLGGQRLKVIRVIAHRLRRGQGIGIHNDAGNGHQRNHRFVVQLNRGFTDPQGGHLGLFRSNDLGDVHRIVPPRHNTGLAFSISERSWHAVSDLHGGVRYTLIYTLSNRTESANAR